jgi:hypothetical protein
MASPAPYRFENLQLPTSIRLSGPTVAVSVSAVIGGILDGLADAVKGSIGLIKRLGCTPMCRRQDRPWLIDTLP